MCFVGMGKKQKQKNERAFNWGVDRCLESNQRAKSAPERKSRVTIKSAIRMKHQQDAGDVSRLLTDHEAREPWRLCPYVSFCLNHFTLTPSSILELPTFTGTSDT